MQISNRLLFGLFLSILCYSGSAQSATDSLLRVWRNTALHDSTRLEAVDAFCRAIVRKHPDSVLLVARSALELARQTRHVAAQAHALTHIGMSCRFRSDFTEAIKAYEQSIYLLEQLNDQAALSDAYRFLGDVYRLQSNYPKAIDCLQQSLAIAEVIGDQVKMADAYVCFSTIYYMSSDNLEQMEEYLLKAKPLYEAAQKEQSLVFVYSNLSLVAYERNQFSTALEYIRKCIAIQEKQNDVFGLATSLQNRATLYAALGRYAEAESDYKKEAEIFQDLGDQEGLSDAYSSLGGLLLNQGQAGAAITWCQKALIAAEKLGAYTLKEQEACQCLAEAYQHLGNYRRALEYTTRFSIIKDSLQNQQTERQLKQMEIERDSLARATVELKKEQAFSRAIQEKNRTVTVLIAFLALGLLFAWALWTRMLFFKRKTLDMQIRSEAMEKQRLLNEIALLKTQVNPHFLFNSLSILSSLVHQNAELSEQFIEQLARSYRYILEQKDQVLVSLRTELEFIQAYAFLLQIRFDHKFELDVALPENIIDRYKIAPLTLQLLVENAVKHNRMSAKEPLRVRVRVDEKYLEIRNVLRPRGERIRSTGIGLQNIINRYALLCDEPVWAGEQEGDFLVKVPLIEH